MKCLNTGMRREAVQEERHRTNNGRTDSRDGNKNGEAGEVESSTGSGKRKTTPHPFESQGLFAN